MISLSMFDILAKINERPKLYGHYTTPLLWNDKHISKKMLDFHLNDQIDLASRNKAFIDQSVDWMVSRFNLGPKTKVCDFGCGPGLYTTSFAKQGAQVTGIDLSERSIQYAQNTAQQEQLKIDYVLQNYLQFSTTQKFHLITMIFLDFCVLSPEQRKIILHQFYQLLEPEGAILLDVCSLNTFSTLNEKRTYEHAAQDGFWSAQPYYAFINSYRYEQEKVFLDKYTIFEEKRTWEILNWLQCFDIDQIKQEFQENGLQIVEYYANVAGEPYHSEALEIAVIAKKLA